MAIAPQIPIEQAPQLGQRVKFLEQLKVIKADPKRFRILLVMIAILLLFGVGIVITVLEQVEKNRPVKTGDVFEQVEIAKQPGEMVWLFYEDENKNGVFDHAEAAVKDVTVSIKRSGDEEVWRTQPVDINGVVKMTDLPVGEYEIRFLNYEEPEAGASSYFYTQYQYMDQFLPSEWQAISLGEEGYEVKVGLNQYAPEKLVVVQDSLGLRLVDLATQTDFAWFRDPPSGEAGLQGLSLQAGKLVYLEKNQLLEFDLNLRTSKVVMDRMYQMEDKKYLLTEDLKLLVYKDGEEFRYRSSECGEGYIIHEGQRLMVDGMKMDIWQSQNVVLSGKIGKQGEWKVYQTRCDGKKFTAEKLFDGQVSSVGYLDAQTLFYSDATGSYFYDLISQKSTKYSALGSNVKARINKERFLVYARVEGKLMVVDYSAVMASGVEKHYVIPMPEGSEPVFVSADNFIYLDNNQVVRIKLKGSGVWEEVERVELKGFQALGILGEIRL